MGPRALLRSGPQGAGQVLHPHRRLRHRLRLRVPQVPHPPQGRQARGPGPAARPGHGVRSPRRRGPERPGEPGRPDPGGDHPRQQHGRGDHRRLRHPGPDARDRRRPRRGARLRRASRRLPRAHRRGLRREPQGQPAADHRGQHARRAVQRDRGTHRQRLRPRRSQLHRRCRLCQLDGRDPGGGQGPPGRRLRRGRDRWRRPHDERPQLHQVLQDRRSVARPLRPLRRQRQRLRDGGGGGHPGAQAPGGRREAGRPDLRADPGHRSQLGRSGQGHHGTEHRRPEEGPAAGLCRRRRGPGRGGPLRVPRHLDGGGGQGRGRGALRGDRRGPSRSPGPGAHRVREVADRAPQERRRSGGHHQDRPGPVPQGAAAEHQLPEGARRRAAGHGAAEGPGPDRGLAGRRVAAPRGGERLRLRRHQLPRGAGGARAPRHPARCSASVRAGRDALRRGAPAAGGHLGHLGAVDPGPARAAGGGGGPGADPLEADRAGPTGGGGREPRRAPAAARPDPQGAGPRWQPGPAPGPRHPLRGHPL